MQRLFADIVRCVAFYIKVITKVGLEKTWRNRTEQKGQQQTDKRTQRINDKHGYFVHVWNC